MNVLGNEECGEVLNKDAFCTRKEECLWICDNQCLFNFNVIYMLIFWGFNSTICIIYPRKINIFMNSISKTPPYETGDRSNCEQTQHNEKSDVTNVQINDVINY